MDARSMLERSSLFGDLSRDILEQLAGLVRIREVAKNTRLFDMGDPGDALYGVVEGKVLIFINAPDGREFSLTVMEAGDVFGEIALVDGRPRTGAARTLERSRLMVIERDPFVRVLDEHPTMARELLMLLCDRIRWSSQLIEEFSLMPVQGRLARRLLTLAELMGRTSSEGVRLKISQSELAQFLGISRQIVNQYLQEWRQSEWLDLSRGQVTIRDWQAIHRICFQSGGG